MEKITYSHKTAINRNKLSVPTNDLHCKGLLKGLILDYGSGKGFDYKYLEKLGYNINGYDPFYKPNLDLDDTYDTIYCNYVFNVIDNVNERIETLFKILNLIAPKGKAYINIRTIKQVDKEAMVKGWSIYNDGFITSKNTFQKGFDYNSFIYLVNLLRNCSNITNNFKFSDNSTYKYTQIIIEHI